MIAGLCDNKLMAPFVFEGNCDIVTFTLYIKEVLVKELRPGQTVVLDNVNFHKAPAIESLIKAAGCDILYLPTYSPDLNPIEHHWFKIKNEIRKIMENIKDVFEAACIVLRKVTT